MSDAHLTIARAATPGTTESGSNSLWQLVSVRFKEYVREPEALFWSFGFPILLAIGLGIAFRSKPADVAHVAFIPSPSAPPAPEPFNTEIPTPERAAHVDSILVGALKRDSLLAVQVLSADSANEAL